MSIGRCEGPAPTAEGRVSLRSVLRESPDLSRLALVRFTGQFGDGMFQAALSGAILFNPERETDPIAIAAAFAVLLLPYSVIGPYAGALLDRWDRRAVLLGANVARAMMIGAVSIGLLVGSGETLLLSLALAVVGISRFVLSGVSAALPRVLDQHWLVPANSVLATAASACAGVGAATAVAIIGGIGTGDFASAVAVAVSGIWSVIGALLAARFAAGVLGPKPLRPKPLRPKPLRPKPLGSKSLGSYAPSPSPPSPSPPSPSALDPKPLGPRSLAPDPLEPNPLSPHTLGPPLGPKSSSPKPAGTESTDADAAPPGTAPPGAESGTAGGADQVTRDSVAHAVATGLRHGATAVWRSVSVTTAMFGIGTHRIVFGANTLIMVLVLRQAPADGAPSSTGLTRFGIAIGFAAAGMLVAAIAAPLLISRLGRSRTVVLGLLMATVVQLTLVTPTALAHPGPSAERAQQLLLVGAFLFGLAGQTIKLTGDATMQIDIDDTRRGQVFALQDTVFNIAFVSAITLAAMVIPANGRSLPLVLIGAGIYCGGIVAIALNTRRNRSRPE